MTATDLPANGSAEHELDAPPWRRVESTILSAATDLRSLYDQRFNEIGITLSLASLLCYVDEFGPVTQTRAADHLRQGRAATGTQVDRLEELDLVERVPDPTDRRVWLLSLTDTGRATAARAIGIDRTVRQELRAGVSRTERQALAKVLIRLQANISSALDADPSPNTDPIRNTNGDQS
ncbi:MAG: MarR family winged helix-turn-helix transcriptional regulator [Acidimicrobiales bacterium]